MNAAKLGNKDGQNQELKTVKVSSKEESFSVQEVEQVVEETNSTSQPKQKGKFFRVRSAAMKKLRLQTESLRQKNLSFRIFCQALRKALWNKLILFINQKNRKTKKAILSGLNSPQAMSQPIKRQIQIPITIHQERKSPEFT